MTADLFPISSSEPHPLEAARRKLAALDAEADRLLAVAGMGSVWRAALLLCDEAQESVTALERAELGIP